MRVFRGKPFCLFWLPVLAWMFLIFSGSSDLLSSSKTSRFIRPALRWLLPGASEETITTVHGAIRKTGHVLEYAVLAALLWRAVARREPGPQTPAWRWPHAVIALVVALGYAITDELHQAMVSSRSGSVLDVGWDTGGALLGLLLVRLWLARRG
jgi:VanZ family protein